MSAVESGSAIVTNNHQRSSSMRRQSWSTSCTRIYRDPHRAGAFGRRTGRILLTRVEYLKHSAAKNFVVVDAAMNDLIRPALYGAWQQVLPLVQSDTQTTDKLYDIVGPVCETGDFLAKDRELAVAAGDLLAVCASGAYVLR